MKVVFFGAGRIGKRMLGVWRKYGVEPDFFADNGKDRWGTLYEGIRVISIDELKAIRQVKILVTCMQADSVISGLEEEGIERNKIYIGNDISDMLTLLISCMSENTLWGDRLEETAGKKEAYSILFDVYCGFVLGGVEAWVLQMAELLSKKDAEIKFITTDLQENTICEVGDKEIRLQYQIDPSEDGRLMKCIAEIKKNLPCNIVCNFVSATFSSACIAKRLWSDSVNLIAVVHSDDEIYYEQYGNMKEWIDFCLVTCDMMENLFLERGMAKEKILRLAWKIPCEETLDRVYSKTGEPIRIGYAGRLEKKTKRLDILIEVAKKLRQAGVDFRLEIAGVGEYEAVIRESVEEFEGQIILKGFIDRNHINEFWKNQDIGVNCSDLEGRCISKAESMAAGAVPVITDTSSARDDVEDGYNGYVIPIGDVEGITNKICYLYHHRELLKVMGERSHQVILNQNNENDLDAMWDRILKK